MPQEIGQRRQRGWVKMAVDVGKKKKRGVGWRRGSKTGNRFIGVGRDDAIGFD